MVERVQGCCCAGLQLGRRGFEGRVEREGHVCVCAFSSAMHLTFAMQGQSGGVDTLLSCSKVRLLGSPALFVPKPCCCVHCACCPAVAPAGHETTAATLGFTLYYIATHPEVEARVLQEIDAVLGSRFEPTVDDIPKLVSERHLEPWRVSKYCCGTRAPPPVSVLVARAAARLCAVETPHSVLLTPCPPPLPPLLVPLPPPHTCTLCMCGT